MISLEAKLFEYIYDGAVAKAIQLIKTTNVDLNGMNASGQTAFMIAADSGYMKLEDAIIASGRYHIGQTDLAGNTSLMYAINNFQNDFANMLIKSYATHLSEPIYDLKLMTIDINGYSVLMRAIQRGMNDVAMQIIDINSDTVIHTDNNGFDALMYACWHNMPDVALCIIKTGKYNPTHTNIHGLYAIDYARQNNMPDIVAILETI